MTKNNQTTISRNAGFTIIELMIATLVFSLIILLLSFGVIDITKVYYKGITQSDTQNTARNVASDISQALQFNGQFTQLSPNGTTRSFCIGTTQYSYRLGYQLTGSSSPAATQTRYALLESDTGCPTAIVGCPGVPDLSAGTCIATGSKELLGQNMRLSNLTVAQPDPNTEPSLYKIDVRVVYGDDDLLYSPSGNSQGSQATDANCRGTAGEQFCAVSELVTTVQQRKQ